MIDEMMRIRVRISNSGLQICCLWSTIDSYVVSMLRYNGARVVCTDCELAGSLESA